MAGLSFSLVLDVSSVSAVLVIYECGRLVKAQRVRVSDAGNGSVRVVRHLSCNFRLNYVLKIQPSLRLAPADLLIQTCTQLWLPNQLHG